MRPHRFARRAADGGARLAGDDQRLPHGGRRLVLGPHDLDLVAVLQFGQKRRMQAVDLGADRGIADVGVHRIGEIDRRRAARQRDQTPLRGEAEHLIVEQFELGMLQELFGRIALGEHFDGAPQPLIGAALAGQGLACR